MVEAAGGGIPVERLGAAAYIRKTTKYVDSHGLTKVYEAYWAQESPPAFILVGPKGIGKSLSLQGFAADKGVPIVVGDCSEDVRRSHLVGSYVPKGEGCAFVLGTLATAIEVANEYGACICDLEEVNALTPQAQKILNPLADFRRRIECPEAARVFELKEGAKLMVAATANGSSYGGVYALNEDLRSRFRVFPIDYPSPEDEARIVAEMSRVKVPAKIVKGALQLAKETRTGKPVAFSFALSPRDVVAFVEDVETIGLKWAIRGAEGKFEEHERETFRKRAEACF